MSEHQKKMILLNRPLDESLKRSLQLKLSTAAEEIAASAICAAGAPQGRAEWAEKNVVLDGARFSFYRHEYLRGIYQCEHHNIVLEKAAQVGGSVFGIIDSLWAIDTGRVRTVIYFFPTNRDLMDFSHDRVRPLILDCPRLSSRVKGIDNAGYKQFMNDDGALSAAIYFRGMKSKVSTSSIPADQIVIDERDKVSTRDYELAVKRISHSDKGFRREACTPTVPDYGIDAAFLRSDMRFWTMKCAACGTWNQPEKTFREDNSPERVLYETDGYVFLGCSKCGAALEPSRGEWVADFPEKKDIAGFHVSQLYSQVVQAGRPIQKIILDDWRNTRYIQDFWNSRIGLPYEDRTTNITRETLNACDGDYAMRPSGATACTMGVDQGNTLHVVISNRRNGLRNVLYAGILNSFEQLDPLMKNFDVRTAVIDALPNTHSARAFAARFPGRVFMCYYSASAKGDLNWNEADRSVSVNRTETLDAALTSYLSKGVRLPRDPIIEDAFKPQMLNMARKPIREENGEIIGYEWVKRGPDHFRHADNYEQIAATRRGRDLGEMLSGVTAIPRGANRDEPISSGGYAAAGDADGAPDIADMSAW